MAGSFIKPARRCQPKGSGAGGRGSGGCRAWDVALWGFAPEREVSGARRGRGAPIPSADPAAAAQSPSGNPDPICSILPVRGHMTQSTVQIVAGILAVILIAIVILRRKGKKSKSADDEF